MDGLQYLMDRMEAVAAVRAADKANDYAKMKHVRSLIQANMEWKPASDGKRSASQASNAAVEGAVVSKRVKMVVLDE